jgi:hypothetical protein
MMNRRDLKMPRIQTGQISGSQRAQQSRGVFMSVRSAKATAAPLRRMVNDDNDVVGAQQQPLYRNGLAYGSCCCAPTTNMTKERLFSGIVTVKRSQVIVLQKGLEFTPGSKRVYSHSGFVLLGLVNERASGQSYADYLHREAAHWAMV